MAVVAAALAGQVTHAVSELVLRRERSPKAEQEMGGRPSHAAPDASNGAQRRATEAGSVPVRRMEGKESWVASSNAPNWCGMVPLIGVGPRPRVAILLSLPSCEGRVPLSDV